MVRSCLEFSSAAWNPFYTVHSQRIERIQRAFTRSLAFTCPGISHRSPYENRLAFFKMDKLRDRRKIRDLSFLYKLVNGLTDCSSILNEISLTVTSRYPRHKISKTFHVKFARTNLAYNSPLSRICRTYNEFNAVLSDLDIFYDSLGVFKNKLAESLNGNTASE